MRLKLNPAGPGTILLLAGAAVLGYMAVRRKKPTTTAAVPPGGVAPPNGGAAPDGGTGNGAGAGTGGETGNFVGTGWVWPRQDKFPTENSFIGWLLGHGYVPGPPDGNVRKPATEGAVMNFQNEFNAVVDYAKDQGWGVPNKLTVDGKIGTNTINAMIQADTLMGTAGMGWKQLVAAAQA